MEQIPTLVKDLALILVVAGLVALVFRKLKQPLVLGYIVAGFIAGPHFVYTPTVQDHHSIEVWAQIGVIVLLFTLGLEFSFKKIVKMGGAPVMAALTIIFSMMSLGYAVGHFFGWTNMDCIYLGGMLAMSSTTIIYKTFQDVGVLQQRFAGLVLSVLILEDILAIVLMVMLSTLAVSNNIEGGDMIYGLLRLLFFLILWFTVGLYLIPSILRRNKPYINDEILLIISLSLCFCMAVVAVMSGFSAAFGAFVVGSILAETLEAERIQKLVSPIKDLFGAIFFVSVGMMVDPIVIVDYAWPIFAIVFTILLGQSVFGTMGFVFSGQPLKEAMKCGCSMSQIGEFAFIIASLGMSLKVISPFLYPIVVAVSVITTFTTPYMLKLASPAYALVERYIPERWIKWLEKNTFGVNVTIMNHSGKWKKLLSVMLKQTVVFSIISVSVIVISFNFFLPFLREQLPHWWANAVCGITTLAVLSPFLRAIIASGHHSSLFISLWHESRANRLPLIFTLLVRVVIVCLFVFYVIRYLVPFADSLLLLIAMLIMTALLMSRRLKKNSIHMEQVFMNNLRVRELHAQKEGRKQPSYASHLMTRDLHLADFVVPENSLWAGNSLSELGWTQQYNVQLASIIRGNHRINIPDGKDRIYPGDKLQIIGTDGQLSAFGKDLESKQNVNYEASRHEMILRQISIDENSQFIGMSIKNSGIRDKYHCMIVGFETSGGELEEPSSERVFMPGDVVWIVGERDDLRALIAESVKQ